MRRASSWPRSLVVVSLAVAGCGSPSETKEPPAPTTGTPGEHASSIALSHDGSRIFVVNADLDSVSILDANKRALVREVLLEGRHPSTSAKGSFTAAVQPRALVLAGDDKTLFVTGERSGKVYAVDTAAGEVTGSAAVGSEPIGVAASTDGKTLFVACSQDATIAKVDVASMKVTGTVTVTAKPWNLTWSSDGTSLIATHLLDPEITSIDPTALSISDRWTIPAVAPRGDKRLAHGQVRGVFDAAVRPKSSELWVAHTLLGIDTAQPKLDFESTAFPALAILQDGKYQETLSTDAQDVPGVDGAFPDVVSGPHALTFTSDGKYALVVDTSSEDLLAVDAEQRIEATVLRPISGHMPEGVALAPNDKLAYVDQRNTGDVAVVKVEEGASGITLALDGAPIPRFASDPMSKEMRLGQHLFFSANSDEYPITKNHWIACATCHMEGRSDAVTWRFAQGPRDTPSNAGGTLGTGFLFRTADRREIQDYFKTINVEQGGNFDRDDPDQAKLLDALETFVDHGMPLPIPPATDAMLVAKGKEIFERSDVGCSSCHSGPRFTDSGAGNPKLDLTGKLELHDVGTCVTKGYPDKLHEDIDGDPRAACQFDTPSLNGIADSAPYLHDGSAATLRDVLEKTRGKMGNISSLSSDDLDALVEYLRSL